MSLNVTGILMNFYELKQQSGNMFQYLDEQEKKCV